MEEVGGGGMGRWRKWGGGGWVDGGRVGGGGGWVDGGRGGGVDGGRGRVGESGAHGERETEAEAQWGPRCAHKLPC